MSSYPPPPGGSYPWGPGQAAAPDDQQATWALAVGIIGIVAGCCCGLLSIGAGIGAIVLARGARDRARAWYGPAADTTMATAAFWVGVGAVALGSLSLVGSVVAIVLDGLIPG